MSAEPLQWEAQEYGCGHDARSGSGRYTVWPVEGEWRVSYHDGGSHGMYLYRGPSLSGGMAAAQAHHDATARRLAWERYMAENDPPERPYCCEAERPDGSGSCLKGYGHLGDHSRHGADWPRTARTLETLDCDEARDGTVWLEPARCGEKNRRHKFDGTRWLYGWGCADLWYRYYSTSHSPVSDAPRCSGPFTERLS